MPKETGRKLIASNKKARYEYLIDDTGGEGGAALPQRLHLGPGQHEPGLHGVLDEVLVAGLLVARDQRATGFLGLRHGVPSLGETWVRSGRFSDAVAVTSPPVL